MPITLNNVSRNAACNAIVDLVDGGVGNGVLVIQDGATDLVELPFSNPAFGNASNGQAIAGTITTTNASASGTADSFEVRDGSGSVLWSGDVTLTGGGGDVELSNLSINSGDPISISSASFTMPAS